MPWPLTLALLLVVLYVVATIGAWIENKPVREGMREYRRWCREEGAEEHRLALERDAEAKRAGLEEYITFATARYKAQLARGSWWKRWRRGA